MANQRKTDFNKILIRGEKMKKSQKLFALVLLCTLIFTLNIGIGFAYENDSIKKQNELEIPKNLYLKISESCKGHKSFEQADANVNGDFVEKNMTKTKGVC